MFSSKNSNPCRLTLRGVHFLEKLAHEKALKDSYPRFFENLIFSIKARIGLQRQNLCRQNSKQC